jgi:hypothetical protein
MLCYRQHRTHISTECCCLSNIFISDEFKSYILLVFSERVWMVDVMLAELQHLTNIYVMFFAISEVRSMKSGTQFYK